MVPAHTGRTFHSLASTHATKSTEAANLKTGDKACLLYYMVTKQSIEQKGIYL